MNAETAKPMTANEAREWMKNHWDADEIGTDLHYEILNEAFEAVFSRLPDPDEDAFAALKDHFTNH